MIKITLYFLLFPCNFELFVRSTRSTQLPQSICSQALQYFRMILCSLWTQHCTCWALRLRKRRILSDVWTLAAGQSVMEIKAPSFIMQVSDALKDIIERVTLDSQGLHGHASLDPPKGLSSVHFTFCPLSCGPQGPRGPPGDGVMGGDKEWTDGRRHLCVCVCVKSTSESGASGRVAVWQNKCCMRCVEVSQWAWSRCCSSRLHRSQDPCA